MVSLYFVYLQILILLAGGEERKKRIFSFLRLISTFSTTSPVLLFLIIVQKLPLCPATLHKVIPKKCI
ncbi:unnamed protein product [Acanthoscelides obtectus]|uniref:Uncharacterized protein n=1 Tax=Acanthoscelides obtectus TaxID=200917 RepID=A0A9P0QDL4_ACAOB|nr:unnamed protein product [Acanthoscelides obtectus]CAK1656658.1 hypothetical protein AOBTE_LOCUS19852 [Acanthoscelides obtectus]